MSGDLRSIQTERLKTAKAGVDLFLSTVGSRAKGNLSLSDMGDDHGLFMVNVAKRIDTPSEIIEINEQATALAEKIFAGTDWIEKSEQALSQVAVTSPEIKELHQRVQVNKTKLEAMVVQLDELEERLVKIIRDYLAAQPDGRILVQREGEGFSESDKVIFSVRGMQNAPYPVWTPKDLALLARVAAVFGEGFKLDINPCDPFNFALHYADIDPIESARKSAAQISGEKEADRKRKAKERISAKKSGNSTPKELNSGLFEAEKQRATGFGEL